MLLFKILKYDVVIALVELLLHCLDGKGLVSWFIILEPCLGFPPVAKLEIAVVRKKIIHYPISGAAINRKRECKYCLTPAYLIPTMNEKGVSFFSV